jgi:hypothetical protein
VLRESPGKDWAGRNGKGKETHMFEFSGFVEVVDCFEGFF